MNIDSAVLMQNVAEGLTLGQKGIESAKVILTGFVVVFAVLFLLIGIIKIYGAVIAAAQKAGDERRRKKTEVREIASPVKAEVPAAQEEPAVEEGISGELVAVISAAVYSMYPGASKPRIKSIRKSRTGSRTPWANAGVLDNTRPF